MKRVLVLCSFIILITAILLPAYSAEVYMWVDEKGVKNISDQPPEKPAKMIGKHTYKRDTPEEIQRYQAEQKEAEQRRDDELRQRQQINRAQEEADREKQQIQPQKDKEELNCYTFKPPGSPYTWLHCKDKNGKLVSKKRN